MKKYLIVIVLFLISLELLLRLFDPLGINYYNRAKDYFENHTIDYKEYYLNDFIAGEIVSNNKVLLIIGDSFVYGFGVKRKNTFPVLMENKIKPTIVSYGVGGWNTYHESLFLRDFGKIIKPDYILLVISDNDLFGGKPHYKFWHKVVYKSYILGHIFFFIKPTLEVTIEQKELARDSFNNIVDFCNSNNIKLFCCLYGYELVDNLKFYAAMLNLEQVPYMLLPKEVFKHRISFIDGHPDNEGHKILAESISQSLNFWFRILNE